MPIIQVAVLQVVATKTVKVEGPWKPRAVIEQSGVAVGIVDYELQTQYDFPKPDDLLEDTPTNRLLLIPLEGTRAPEPPTN